MKPHRNLAPNRRLGLAALLAVAILGIALVVGFLMSPRVSEQHLGTEEFAALVEQHGAVLIDVRTPEEFAEGHLAGARNIDAKAKDFPQQIAALDRAATYAVYCCAGGRSAEALNTMRKSGFTDVSDLDGGITRWIREGRKVVSD